MNRMLARLHDLPPQLLDGRWTQCALVVTNGRIRFREPEPLSEFRRRRRLRRRVLCALGGLASFAAMLLSGAGEAQLVLGLLGSLLALAALDGLRGDLEHATRPFEYAVIDSVRGEVDLRSPGGWLMTAKLRDVRLYLMVADVRRRRCHVGMLVADGSYLPWLTTAAPQAAMALTWLFGHLTELPALRVVGTLPLSPDWVQSAEPIPSPLPDSPG